MPTLKDEASAVRIKDNVWKSDLNLIVNFLKKLNLNSFKVLVHDVEDNHNLEMNEEGFKRSNWIIILMRIIIFQNIPEYSRMFRRLPTWYVSIDIVNFQLSWIAIRHPDNVETQQTAG